MLCIAQMTVLAGLAFSSAAWAFAAWTPCSNDSLRGMYGFLHGGIDSHGTPAVAVTQLSFDPTH